MDIEKMTLPEVIPAYIKKSIKQSWTWARLTPEERKRFDAVNIDRIKGNKKQRIEAICAIYTAFLAGVGYDSPRWREPEPETVPNF